MNLRVRPFERLCLAERIRTRTRIRMPMAKAQTHALIMIDLEASNLAARINHRNRNRNDCDWLARPFLGRSGSAREPKSIRFAASNAATNQSRAQRLSSRECGPNKQVNLLGALNLAPTCKCLAKIKDCVITINAKSNLRDSRTHTHTYTNHIGASIEAEQRRVMIWIEIVEWPVDRMLQLRYNTHTHTTLHYTTQKPRLPTCD